LKVLDKDLTERIAGALGTRPGLIEKDWHVVRALGVLVTLEHQEIRPVFSGGTSLAKGWGLIKRFSEDIDFKVEMPPAKTKAEGRRLRSSYREEVLALLTRNDFELAEDSLVGNESQFFSVGLAYPSRFEAGQGLRPHIRVEMSFHAPALMPINRPISSIIALAGKEAPEVAAFPCVDPVETAADKLSTLAWRVCARERGSANDDPTIIRHLHDLAALESHIRGDSEFPALARKTVEDDSGRGGEGVPAGAWERFSVMLERLGGDRLWEREYEAFVLQVSFARGGEEIPFAEAFAATKRLVTSIYENQ
jgi:predicted nucleotidyltransferase component of viral defense system